MRLLLDTNVVFSALLWRGAAYALLSDISKRSDVRLFTSRVLIDELTDILTRPSATQRLALIGKTAAQVVADYAEAVEVIEMDASAPVPRVVPTDADDDFVVAAALAAGVDAIVTGDSDLLAVGSFARSGAVANISANANTNANASEPIKVLTVAALRELLAAQE